MATVDGITAAKAQEIEDASVVSGAINGSTGHLILTTAGGTEIDAGLVVEQTLSGKTLIEPTIASFVNAQHDHSDADDGGSVVLTHGIAYPFTSQSVSSASQGPKIMASLSLGEGLWFVSTTCEGYGTNGVTTQVKFQLDSTGGDWGPASYPTIYDSWGETGIARGFTISGLLATPTTTTVRTQIQWVSGASGTAGNSTVGQIIAIRIGPNVAI